jgi:hypothetical protein
MKLMLFKHFTDEKLATNDENYIRFWLMLLFLQEDTAMKAKHL